MRDTSSLHYFEVHAGFVHHTVNANDYTRAEVPGILRSIYAYHTQSRGWSDVGYNFLVDRFGRIWEGRYGGVDRPVVGAHTLGYNDDAFAMSAIGNFELVQPSQAMIEAYAALFAWKLSLHGVTATSSKQYVTKRYFQAINGHRDAASTACPGKYLYAKIPEIRGWPGGAAGWAGRQLESTSGPGRTRSRRPARGRRPGLRRAHPEARRHLQGRQADRHRRRPATANRIMNAGDWDRNGYGDIMFRHKGTATCTCTRPTRRQFAPPCGSAAGSRTFGCWRRSAT